MTNSLLSSDRRYHLFGDITGWSEYHVFSNNLKDLKLEAYDRLKQGYSAYIEDRQENTLSQIKLKDTK